ncbi:hypothetical protein F4803DRAFT_219191 [Xylaria telfairii]|nr:hypothetical protein F4803DRAFT_219191 [Xylaria telfairii]
MIRQPFNSAIGRTRADLSRVADGIAASLRAFSTAQQLAAAPQDGDNGNRSQPTGRQRAAAAFSDLVGMNSGSSSRPSQASNTAFKTLDLRSNSALPNGSLPGVPNVMRGGPDVIRGSPNIIRGGPNVIRGTPNIIRGGLRGGFRGRGGFNRGGGGAGRGGGMGPARRGGRRGGDRERGPGRRQGQAENDDNEAGTGNNWSPEVIAMREAKERGTFHKFDPSISRSDLAGWGPAVATANSSFAKDETVIRQARILGGGQPFHPLNALGSDDMWTQYKNGTGVFFPTEEAKKWAAETMGVEAFPPVPKETKDAVLQDALLGTYRGPQYVELQGGTFEPLHTLGIVQNYVRKDSSWNTDAQRRIEEKVRSLLPGGRTGPANAASRPSANA